MQSKEFITEASVSKNIAQLVKQYDIEEDDIQLMHKIVKIGRKCKPYLKQVSDPLSLLRGINANDEIIIKKQIRLDHRTPLGMNKYIQQSTNKYFDGTFGAPFRNAMLCTGSDYMAGGFGDVYIVFPIGKFEFLWSPVVADLNELFWLEEAGNWGDKLDNDDVIRILADSEYTMHDLDAAIASEHEIMIRGKGYYGILAEELEYMLPIDVIIKLLKIGMKE